jgi:hypothetical protein
MRRALPPGPTPGPHDPFRLNLHHSLPQTSTRTFESEIQYAHPIIIQNMSASKDLPQLTHKTSQCKLIPKTEARTHHSHSYQIRGAEHCSGRGGTCNLARGSRYELIFYPLSRSVNKLDTYESVCIIRHKPGRASFYCIAPCSLRHVAMS